MEQRIPNKDPSAIENRTEPERIPSILLCLDRSELSETVLAYAVMLTRVVSGSLTLMHVVESSNEVNSNSHDMLMWELKQREARQYMSQVLECITKLKIPAKLEIAQGRAAEQILGYIRQHSVDYVILASHGKHGLTEWSLSSTAAKIIDRALSSFIIVPAAPHYQHSEMESNIQRILVPLDDSLSSQACLPIAIRIAKQQNAELILAHAIETSHFDQVPGITHAVRSVIKNTNTILETVARDYFRQISLRLQSEGLKVSVVVKPSPNPITLICEIVASMNIDFIVMSAHGASRTEECALARTSAQMTSHTPVPLLVVQDLEREKISRVYRKRLFRKATLRCSKSTASDMN